MKILAIDPGNTQSAWVIFNDGELTSLGLRENRDFLTTIADIRPEDLTVVIERVASYGMAVGATVFETCFWTGRFIQFFVERGVPEDRIILMPRMDVKMHLCKSSRAKDGNIRQALIDRFGEPGTKKNPGMLYGVKKDIWAALAIGVTAMDKIMPISDGEEGKYVS